MNVNGRCAVVTGAASGMGRATAEALHADGANVVLLDVQRDRLDSVAKELGARCVPIVTDVSNAEHVQAAIDLAVTRFGTVHIAVNCAGVPSSIKTVSNGIAHDLKIWQRVIDVNLTGTFNVTRIAAAQMVRNEPDAETGERGVIINTASIAAYEGTRGQAAYAASKGGVVSLSLPVARDLCDHAVRCVAIAPGLFDTGMVSEVSDKVLAEMERLLLYPDRMGDTRELAALIKHIVENPYINGTCLRIDGGLRGAGPTRSAKTRA